MGILRRTSRLCSSAQTSALYSLSIVRILEMEFHPLPPVLDGRIRSRRKKEQDVLRIVAVVLIVLWLLGFFAFHITSGLIHIVLVVAVIMLILHFVSSRE
jgi:Family of unknown function (DUF5670)